MSTSNKEYEKKLNIALEIYKDISRQIQFADTKAGLILAWHGASLGFLSKIVTDKLQEITSVGLKVLTLTSFVYSLFLASLSIAFAFLVILPRLKDTTCQRECMFWIYHISCESFERDLHRFKENVEDPERVLNCLSRSVVAVAGILKEKYKQLQNSLLFLAFALVFEALTVVLLIFSNL